MHVVLFLILPDPVHSLPVKILSLRCLILVTFSLFSIKVLITFKMGVLSLLLTIQFASLYRFINVLFIFPYFLIL
jgi:hypothetical protein